MHNHNAVAAATFLAFLFGPAVLASAALRERVDHLRGLGRSMAATLAGMGHAVAVFASGDWLPNLPTLPAMPKFQWARRTPSPRQVANMPRMLQQMYQPQPMHFREIDPALFVTRFVSEAAAGSAIGTSVTVTREIASPPAEAQVIQPEVVPHHFAPPAVTASAQFERLDLGQYTRTASDPDRTEPHQTASASAPAMLQAMPEPERIHTPRPYALPFRQLRSAMVRALLFSFDLPSVVWRMARKHYSQPSARKMTRPPMLTVRGMAPPW